MLVHNVTKPRYFKEKYKTKQGAEKRARFENMLRKPFSKAWHVAVLTLEGDEIVYRVQKQRLG